MVAETQTGSIRDFPAYLHFTPRPDQPDKFDEQTAFYESKTDGVSWLVGGNGCIGSEQELWDHVLQRWVKCTDITKPFITVGIGPNGPRLQASSPVYKKGTDDLYKVSFRSADPIICTSSHRVLTDAGWQTVGTLVCGSLVSQLTLDAFPEVAHIQPDDTNYQQTNLASTPTAQSSVANAFAGLQVPAATVEPVRESHRYGSCGLSPGELCDQVKRVPLAYDQQHRHTTSDSQGDCQRDQDCGDVLLHDAQDIAPDDAPSQGDAEAHNHSPQPGGLASEPGYIHDCQLRIHRSTANGLNQTFRESQHHSAPECSKQFCLCSQPVQQQQALSEVLGTSPQSLHQCIGAATARDHLTGDLIQEILAYDESLKDCIQIQMPSSQSEHHSCEVLPSVEDQFQSVASDCLSFDIVEKIEFVRTDVFYDISCFPDSNYITKGGIVSHNSGTTTTLLAKVARFIYETPPPRRDTPFWVIAKSYDQVTKTCWKEKLYGQGHILDRDVDWDRVGWYKSKQRLPYSVPLKADHKGNNWMLEFRSYEQGIGAMMAQAIGGFAFVEQFPWGVFEEVLRGCREYNFPGSKLVEYTPVDPDLSIDIEEMLENGVEPEKPTPGLRYLPKNWEIYHANTQCAMEAGHVDKRWFEEFFGMVPKDMLDTRMKGLFCTFEGVIYKDFNTAVHCMGDEMWPRIKNCHHRRGIDWGAGPENDFACTWGARNGLGQWFIYDEIACHDQSKTTVDHLSDVYNQWEWPDDNSLYGPTYCDPSSPDNLRIAQKLSMYNTSVENLSMMRGKNSVIEGIEHVQYLLKPQIPVPMHDKQGNPIIDPETGKVKIHLEPKLFIHRQNCPKLVQQMKTYRWLRGSNKNSRIAVNPKDAPRQPLKKADHQVDSLRYLTFSDDFMTGSTISSAKNHSALTSQLHGEYIPRQGLRGFTTQHRDRG
jgi:hypothetical protein